MSAKASDPAFGSRLNLKVVSTASAWIASAVRPWTDGGVFGSVKASKRGKNACSFSMEMDSLGIMSQKLISRRYGTHKDSRSGGDAGQEVSTVTFTGGDNTSALTRYTYTGNAWRRARRSLILHPVMDSWSGCLPEIRSAGGSKVWTSCGERVE